MPKMDNLLQETRLGGPGLALLNVLNVLDVQSMLGTPNVPFSGVHSLSGVSYSLHLRGQGPHKGFRHFDLKPA